MSFSKRIEDARKAYSGRDRAASRAAHAPDAISRSLHEASERHGGIGSQYIGDLIYGGLDGIITTFAVVCGVVGADLGSDIILILGLANLLADGFSMATGAYLSTKSEQEYYDKERERELWEIEHLPDGEELELKEIYRSKGYSEQEAIQLVDIMSRNTERFLQAMMVDELGMVRDDREPMQSGFATFLAFVTAGSIPLLVYTLGLFVDISSDAAFVVSIVLSGFALFGLGAAKVLVTRHNPVRSGLEMLVVGGFAAAVAFGVGALLSAIVQTS